MGRYYGVNSRKVLIADPLQPHFSHFALRLASGPQLSQVAIFENPLAENPPATSFVR